MVTDNLETGPEVQDTDALLAVTREALGLSSGSESDQEEERQDESQGR